MTKEEAIGYIENYGWSTTRLGLERTRELLERVGNPQKKLKFVHVAGSNGKGSTCAMLANIMQYSGYKVGMYISPYIQDFCERIQINGEYIDGDSLARITEYVMAQAEAMDDHPSQFELVTAIGMIYFLENNVDIVVLEVGMGGALDSTNAIDAPEVAVITNIGLEHTEYLGNTIEEIAATKAGIIKT
ncbi:MAG: bifunctional folylpolyglutamate synthase/dihydrofolate synthase, partial [Firmicutes bacterium]|nr:bifunctional folylpolyglutamate synthase/dihydrofolate synthase [Bacillota bacterium]